MALLHSTVNPVLHALPFFLLLAPVAGMAVGGSFHRREKRLPSQWPLRLAGLAMVAAGGVWLATASGRTIAFGETGQRVQLEAMAQAVDDKDHAAALAAADLAVRAAPLHWEGYFDRAAAKLLLGYPHNSALADFATVRYLEPSLFSLPMDEATVWLDHSPALAISAWREALRRVAADPQLQAGLYSVVLGQMRTRPEWLDEVRSLATTPQMLVHYLNNAADDEDARAALRHMLDQHPSLGLLTHLERRYVFNVWYQRGDRQELISQIKENPAWLRDGWPFLARQLAENGDPAAAYQLALKYLEQPARLTPDAGRSLRELERDASFNPNDPRTALALYAAQMDQGQYELAMKTLIKVKAMPTAPRYIDYEFARVHAANADYDQAWKAMDLYMRLNPDK
jgi:tetratricopeptide (TPR) repeat protein